MWKVGSDKNHLPSHGLLKSERNVKIDSFVTGSCKFTCMVTQLKCSRRIGSIQSQISRCTLKYYIHHSTNCSRFNDSYINKIKKYKCWLNMIVWVTYFIKVMFVYVWPHDRRFYYYNILNWYLFFCQSHKVRSLAY